MNATDPRGGHHHGGVGSAGLFAAVLSSLFVPGVGQMMIGRPVRGAIWLAGFVLLLATGGAHLLPGILLMLLAAADTWWVGSHIESGTEAKGDGR